MSKPFRWMELGDSRWQDEPDDDTDIELRLKGICWPVRKSARVLYYNCVVPIVKNSVDLVLLDCDADEFSKQILKSPGAYLALGELKGGIDPAGADEHWKTARSALGRIQSSFARHDHHPKKFFVGAAVEAKMAMEIWDMLSNGELDNAANLTDENQVASLTRWLCSL